MAAKKKREVVNIPVKIVHEILSEETEDWVIVEDELIDNDQEKGIEDHEVVVRRVEDNKFFTFSYYSGNYEDWFDHNRKVKEVEFVEVFPKKVTVTKYE